MNTNFLVDVSKSEFRLDLFITYGNSPKYLKMKITAKTGDFSLFTNNIFRIWFESKFHQSKMDTGSNLEKFLTISTNYSKAEDNLPLTVEFVWTQVPSTKYRYKKSVTKNG